MRAPVSQKIMGVNWGRMVRSPFGVPHPLLKFIGRRRGLNVPGRGAAAPLSGSIHLPLLAIHGSVLLTSALLGQEGYGGGGEKEEGKRFSLWVHCLIKGSPTLTVLPSVRSPRGTCIVKNVQVPPLPGTSLKLLVTAWPRRGGGEPPAAWQSRIVPLPVAVRPPPSTPVPGYHNGVQASVKSDLNAALRAAGISPSQNAADVLGIVWFARSPPLHISLRSCADVPGASELFGDKAARFGLGDALLSLV